VKCPYEMQVSRGKNRFTVWDCQLEADHDGWHSPPLANEGFYDMQERIKMNYYNQGNKPKEESPPVVLATGEAALSEVVKMNDKGKINKQSIMGKAADLLLHSPLELKAGKSVYRDGEKDGTLVWLEARGHGVHVRVTPSKTSTIVYWNHDKVDIAELERRIEDYRDTQER
jgi:hypothetical protein